MGAMANRQQWDRETRERRTELLARINVADNLAAAMALLNAPPAPDAPGRAAHSNLSFFLQTFKVPGASDHEERKAYLALLKRLHGNGEVKEGACVIREFEASMTTAK
jgi:hypothetical protein